jgi:hypothetical protein
MTDTPVTEDLQDAPAPAGSERSITFRGREIWVKLPSPEQYLVWQRSIKMIEKMEDSEADWNASQVLRALERGRGIIDSVILNEPDKEWLDNQWLDGAFGLVETVQILQLATEAFAEDDTANRATKRAAKKAAPKKTVRRKVADK